MKVPHWMLLLMLTCSAWYFCLLAVNKLFRKVKRKEGKIMDFDEWCWWLDSHFNFGKKKPGRKKKLTKKVKAFKKKYEKAIKRGRTTF